MALAPSQLTRRVSTKMVSGGDVFMGDALDQALERLKHQVDFDVGGAGSKARQPALITNIQR